MKRLVFRAYIKKGAENEFRKNAEHLRKKCVKAICYKQIYTISCFIFERNVFLYYECTNEDITPADILGELGALLEAWPGEPEPRFWVPMTDIYHSLDDQALALHRGKEPVHKTSAGIARLKHEKVSSYIFYHYQLQEERPGNFSKWCSIFLHENIAIIYGEEPDSPAPIPERRTLFTNNTPDCWGDLMKPHFKPWEDTQPDETLWRNTECLWFI